VGRIGIGNLSVLCELYVSVVNRQAAESGFFGDDFTVFPYIDRRAVHARGLARHFGGAAQRAPHRC